MNKQVSSTRMMSREDINIEVKLLRDDIDTLKTQRIALKNRTRKFSLASTVSLFAFAIIFILSVNFGLGENNLGLSKIDSPLFFALSFVFFLLGCYFGSRTTTLSKECESISKNLSQSSFRHDQLAWLDSGFCEDVLGWASSYPEVEQYRQEVNTLSRRFTHQEYIEIKVWVKARIEEDEAEKEAEELREKCHELYGLHHDNAQTA
jgi:hypothetical protein